MTDIQEIPPDIAEEVQDIVEDIAETKAEEGLKEFTTLQAKSQEDTNTGSSGGSSSERNLWTFLSEERS